MARRVDVFENGADRLTKAAKNMPIAMDNIVTETDNLLNVYNAVSEHIGEYNQDFSDLLMHIKKAQQTASYAILELLPKIKEFATKLEAYININW